MTTDSPPMAARGHSPAATADIPPRLATLNVYTTGQVARVCRVAPKTVAKWFDAGRLKGYRVPGAQDRRVPRAELVSFLDANGMADALASVGGRSAVAVAVAVGVECAVPGELPAGWSRRRCDYATGLLAAATDPAVRAVLVHAGVGAPQAREFAAAVRVSRGACPLLLVYVAGADLWPVATPGGFDAALVEPIDPAAFWAIAEAQAAKGGV